MENASKALIMAAEILMGVMIISVAVYVFSTMGEYSAVTTAEIEETQVNQFNNRFLQYYGYSGGEVIKCTIHDIVGLANFAKQYNEENGFTGAQNASDYSYYVQIDLKLTSTITNLEAKDQSELIELIKNNDVLIETNGGTTTATTIYFKCTEIRSWSKYRKS